MSRLVKKMVSVTLSVSFLAAGVVEANACGGGGGGYRGGYVRSYPSYSQPVVYSSPAVVQRPLQPGNLPLLNNANGPIQQFGGQTGQFATDPNAGFVNNGQPVQGGQQFIQGNNGQAQPANFAPQQANPQQSVNPNFNAGGQTNVNPNLGGPAVNNAAFNGNGATARQANFAGNGQPLNQAANNQAVNPGVARPNNVPVNGQPAQFNRGPANAQPVNNAPVNSQPVNQGPAADPMSNVQLQALQALEASEDVSTSVPQGSPLVGEFTATLGNGATIKLSLGENGAFRWSATNNGQSSEFDGSYTLGNSQLSLQRRSDSQKMDGTLTATDSGFIFKLNGAKDNGLNFVRG